MGTLKIVNPRSRRLITLLVLGGLVAIAVIAALFR